MSKPEYTSVTLSHILNKYRHYYRQTSTLYLTVSESFLPLWLLCLSSSALRWDSWGQNISSWPSGGSAPPPLAHPLSEPRSKLLLKCFLMKKKEDILSVSPLHSGSVHSSIIAALVVIHLVSACLCYSGTLCTACTCFDQPLPCTQMSWLIRLLPPCSSWPASPPWNHPPWYLFPPSALFTADSLRVLWSLFGSLD